MAETLSDICRDIHYYWYISLGKLYIHPKEVDALVANISVGESNVKGSIGVLDDKSSHGTFSKGAKPKGLKITTYLNGNITTNTTLNVNYGEHEGDYKITSVSHKLNFRGNSWDTVISCQRLAK